MGWMGRKQGHIPEPTIKEQLWAIISRNRWCKERKETLSTSCYFFPKVLIKIKLQSVGPRTPASLAKGVHIWKILWHLDLPERLKVFLWKCARGILPVKLGLSTRLHRLSPICRLCESFEESLDHLFLQCAVNQPIWRNTPFRVTNTAQSFQDWLMDWVIGLTASTNEKDRFFTFIGTLWAIWKTRNAKVFSATPFLSSTALALAADHALWFKRASVWNDQASTSPSQPPSLLPSITSATTSFVVKPYP